MGAEEAAEGATPRRVTLLQERVTRQILRAYFEVQRDLRPGFLESVYSAAFGLLLREYGLAAQPEAPVDVHFHGSVVGTFRADYLVERNVIVELKAVRRLDEAHMAQLANYLRATDVEVGLLLNFGRERDFRRMIMQNARRPFRTPPRDSAVSRGESREPT